MGNGLVPESEIKIGNGNNVAIFQHTTCFRIFDRERSAIHLCSVPASQIFQPAGAVAMIFQHCMNMRNQRIFNDDIASI